MSFKTAGSTNAQRNLGGAGTVVADGARFDLGFQDCLYVTKGTRTVTFSSADKANPARFYMVSAPAHKACKTTFLSLADAKKKPVGDPATSNKRVINQFIHPDVLETCQLSMGLTRLEPGSVWNTLPPHTHDRRSEVYLYFDLAPGHRVAHLMGEPHETRALWVGEKQLVLSPPWSIHCGAGTGPYAFVWGMGGENQRFDDMDPAPIPDLR